VLPGTDRAAKAILLLAHLDVVEARREDWTRDPFTLVEKAAIFTAAAPSTIIHGRRVGGHPDPAAQGGVQT